MEIKITRSGETGKWEFIIDGELITTQGTLTKLLFKAYKYVQSQGK